LFDNIYCGFIYRFIICFLFAMQREQGCMLRYGVILVLHFVDGSCLITSFAASFIVL